MHNIELTLNQWMDLIYHKWPSRPADLIFPAHWFVDFAKWLQDDFSARVTKDQQGNLHGLEFADESKATDFVLRYV